MRGMGSAKVRKKRRLARACITDVWGDGAGESAGDRRRRRQRAGMKAAMGDRACGPWLLGG